MTKDEMMQMARDAGFRVWVSDSEFSKGVVLAQPVGNYCQDNLMEFANAILERAASECDETDIEEARGGPTYYAQLGDAGATRDAIENAIRAMKIKEGE